MYWKYLSNPIRSVGSAAEVVMVGDFSVIFTVFFLVWVVLCLSVSGAGLTVDETVVYCFGQASMGWISRVGSASMRWVTSFFTSFGRGSSLMTEPFFRVAHSTRIKPRFLLFVFDGTGLEMTVWVILLSGGRLRSARGMEEGASGGLFFTMVMSVGYQRLRRKGRS